MKEGKWRKGETGKKAFGLTQAFEVWGKALDARRAKTEE